MSKWLPDDIKEKIMKKDVQTYKKSQKELTDEQKVKVRDAFRSFIATEYAKPINERSIFKDEFGGYIMLIKTAEDLNVKEDKKGRGYFFGLDPILEEDVQVYIDDLEQAKTIGRKSPLLLVFRGWAAPKYRDLGSDEYHIDEEKYCKQKGVQRIEDLDSDTYSRRYKLNVWEYLTAFK